MELELDVELNKIRLGFLFVGLVLGIGVAVGAANVANTGERASNQLISFLENQSGQELDLVDAQDAGRFYRVDVRTADNQLITYYTDGKKFTSSIQDIENLNQRATALTEFSECLQESGTVMFGNSTQRATQAQIQVLGGLQVVAPIYRDVTNNQTLQQAAQLGIQQVPSFYHNESAIQGVQSIQQVEQFTGCETRLN